jgi:hypothetical protein
MRPPLEDTFANFVARNLCTCQIYHITCQLILKNGTLKVRNVQEDLLRAVVYTDTCAAYIISPVHEQH